MLSILICCDADWLLINCDILLRLSHSFPLRILQVLLSPCPTNTPLPRPFSSSKPPLYGTTLIRRATVTSLRNPLRTENPAYKTERTKPLRTQNGTCEFNACDPNSTFIDIATPRKPCKLNLRIEALPIAGCHSVRNKELACKDRKVAERTFTELFVTSRILLWKMLQTFTDF